MGNDSIRELRDAFGAFMTGVTVVTTSDKDHPIGFTANSFTSVSIDPALISVNIAKTSGNYSTFVNSKHFAVNILSDDQRDISNIFARPSEDRFSAVIWKYSAQKNPLIEGVSAWFDCTVYKIVDAGDHAILIGKIENFESTVKSGLGFYRGSYFNPAVSTEVISGPGVTIGALVGFEDKVLLEQKQDGKWGIPMIPVSKEGADKVFERLLDEYQPELAPSFIYSVYNDKESKQQYIVYLCHSTLEKPLLGKYFNIEALNELELSSSALASMLERYRKEYYVQAYGFYYGSDTDGIIKNR